VSVARLLLSHRAIALLRRTLAAPPLVLNRVTTFGLSWFVVTFCNKKICSDLTRHAFDHVFLKPKVL
jgi:hypothetical protein